MLHCSGPLKHMKVGMHAHFVTSEENLLLKTFVEPQLAKLPSFTGKYWYLSIFT